MATKTIGLPKGFLAKLSAKTREELLKVASTHEFEDWISEEEYREYHFSYNNCSASLLRVLRDDPTPLVSAAAVLGYRKVKFTGFDVKDAQVKQEMEKIHAALESQKELETLKKSLETIKQALGK